MADGILAKLISMMINDWEIRLNVITQEATPFTNPCPKMFHVKSHLVKANPVVL